MKKMVAVLPLLMALTALAGKPIKVEGVAGLVPGDEITVDAGGDRYQRGQAVSLVDSEAGPWVVHARVVGRVAGGKLKVRVVPEES